MRRFERGRDFEYAFKATFPGGIDVSVGMKRDIDLIPERTAQLLDGVGEMVIFEAGFLYDDVLVLADVVQRNEDGSIDVFEVKSGTALSDTYCHDAALQHYVISHCRKVNSFSVVYNGGTDQSDYFKKVDLTDNLQAQHNEIARNIAAMKEILSHGEPATATGQHCLTPYACPYQHYCAQGVRQMSLFG